MLKLGTSEVVQKFDEFYSEYGKDWANRDEKKNIDQNYDPQKTREEVLPLIEKTYKDEVD